MRRPPTQEEEGPADLPSHRPAARGDSLLLRNGLSRQSERSAAHLPAAGDPWPIARGLFARQGLANRAALGPGGGGAWPGLPGSPGDGLRL